MKRDLFAFVVAAGLLAGSAAAGAWELQSAYVQAQPQKGGPGPGAERGDRGRDGRGERREERRDRMTEDERRALQRDVEKANRELYGRRPQK
ncbi:MAG: hypothetical protein ACXWCY_08360 [Burkholderiales bacterium]|jgi:hypothetical protein